MHVPLCGSEGMQTSAKRFARAVVIDPVERSLKSEVIKSFDA